MDEAMRDELQAWQDRLATAFRGPGGLTGERLKAVLDGERRYADAAVRHRHDFTVLLDSFQDFFVQTFDEMLVHPHVKNINTCAILISSFQRLRYALQGFYHGYPQHGAGSLRAVFENAFYVGAVLRGVIKHDELYAFMSSLDLSKQMFKTYSKAQRKHLQALDQRVTEHTRGSYSGLSTDDQEAIAKNMGLLHGHVHRAESSVISATIHMTKTCTLPSLAPHFDAQESFHFSTPVAYASWLLLRVLPFVSYPPDYSSNWRERYSILDDSFRSYIHRLKGEGYDAFCRMVDTTFNFDQEAGWAAVKVNAISATASGPP